MRLKNFTLSILFLFSFVFANAQCEVENGSFEEWFATEFILPDGMNGEATGDVLLPETHTPLIRLLLLSFAAAFDPTYGMLLENEAQELSGISQSTDASDGDFAVKLQGGYEVETADIYSVAGCTEVPTQFNLDVKHFGESDDIFTILVVFDEGLKALPQTEDDLENLPAYASATLNFDSNTEYQTISFPVIQNFEAPVDTFYYVILAETFSDSSYFLIDNVNFNDGGSGCQITAPVLTMDSEASPVCICNNLDVSFSLEYTTEPNIEYNELIVDEFGMIVSIDDFIPGIHSEFCNPSNSLKAVVIAYEDGVQGLNEGSLIDDITGCFELSNEIMLETTTIPDFVFNVFMDGVQQDENINICLLDDILETFSFSTDIEVENIAIVVINEENEITEIRIDDINETTDLMNLAPGDYVMGAVSYDVAFNLEVGQDADEITFEGCFSVSDFVYEINVLGPDDNCVTDVEEVYKGNLSIRPNYSAGIFEIDNPNAESFDLVIRDIAGNVVTSNKTLSNGNLIDLTGFPSGLYIASFNIDGLIHQEKLVKL